MIRISYIIKISYNIVKRKVVQKCFLITNYDYTGTTNPNPHLNGKIIYLIFYLIRYVFELITFFI